MPDHVEVTATGPRTASSSDSSDDGRYPRLLWPRLLIGWIVIISAEVFSGASLKMGLWHPVMWLLTFWLYFGHFFFFTTLAVKTRRTSFWSLYLWGVLFGLYESWITKVIWSGYDADGKFALGKIGPYGFAEISMVVIYHPIMSFILPLAVACILFPPLRRCFPDLAWFTGSSRWARILRVYLMVGFGTIVAMNSGGPVNLALNLVFGLLLLVVFARLSRPAFLIDDSRPVVVFGKRGFIGLCIYLAVLYEVTYFLLRPEALPSRRIQWLTLVFYALTLAGLWLHRRREPADAMPVVDARSELRRAKIVVGVVLGLGFLLSFLRGSPAVFIPVVVSFVIWTPLGFLLLLIAIAKGVNERRKEPSGSLPTDG